jgi:hypothetical protein
VARFALEASRPQSLLSQIRWQIPIGISVPRVA